MVTDSDACRLLPATAASINRRSGLFSAQKPASASSLSKIGTSSHLAIARISLRQSVRVTGNQLTNHSSPITSYLLLTSHQLAVHSCGIYGSGKSIHQLAHANPFNSSNPVIEPTSGPSSFERRIAPRAETASRKSRESVFHSSDRH